MATTAIWDVTDRLNRVLNYATNPEKTVLREGAGGQSLQHVLDYTQADAKTERQWYVSGINCDPVTACEQMQRTKQQFQKAEGILAFHGYQAFAPGEATPETAHAIGVKLAQELWGERFEVVVSTHLDKHHLHNHFVLNSVSFIDGKRYYDNKTSYALLRKTSDQLCREHTLSVIEQPEQGNARHYGEWKAEQEGKPTWRGLIRNDIDQAIAASMTFTQFIAALRKQGYEVKTAVKYLAVRPPGKERFVRLRSLGDLYTEEALKQRILQNRMPKRQLPLPLPRRRRIVQKGSLRTARKLTGLQALYFRYLYQMGLLPSTRSSPKRVSFLLREDLRRMETITAQTKLLCAHRISSKEQLFEFQATTEQEMNDLNIRRKALYNRIRRSREPAQTTAYKEQISAISRRLSVLRKEVKLCADIMTRSRKISEKLNRTKQENRQRKEAAIHESWSRGSRSSRQHESAGH